MFKNYFKIALRNIKRHKVYSFINTTGLAIGIACCILVFLFIKDEFSYDTFHENANKLFRVNSVFEIKGNTHKQAVTPAPLGPAIKADLPEVEFATRFLNWNSIVKYLDKTFKEKLTYADPDIFKMFSFPLLLGNTDQALTGKNSIVISQDIAIKYFGDNDPIGKRISVNIDDGFEDFIVSGVAGRIRHNSSIKFDFLISFEKLKDFVRESSLSDWGLFSLRTFVQLNELSNAGEVNKKLPMFIEKYVENSRAKYILQPLKNIHFGYNVEAGMSETSNIAYSYILYGIACLILFIACINFMNISVAHSSVRYKEIGLRKVMGAARFQLMGQFWFEALIMSTIAFAIGILFTELILPLFNSITDKALSIDYTGNWYSVFGVIALILFVGFISGTYPALFLSKYLPVETIKGRQKIGRKNSFTRSLVIFQFAISIFLIISTSVIIKQLGYMKNKNLGFNSEQILVLPTASMDGRNVFNILQNELKQYNSILSIAGSNAYPGGGYNGTTVKTVDSIHNVNIARIDYNFLELYGMKLKQGRNFSEEITSDGKHSVIINETLFNDLGWESANGKKLTMNWGGLSDVSVIGVVENFHFTSLHEKIESLVFYVNPDVDIDYIFLKIKPEKISGTITLLKETWQTVAPEAPFEYFFLQEEFEELYRTEEQWSQITKYSSLLAIVIACFGLLGLSALVITKRTKEIGIRKVLGSSVPGIVALLSKEFTKWVLLANIIAWPIAWYAMNKWLQDFPYRINIGWWTFVLAGALALVIALLTVSYQAIRAATANPVEALRYE